MSLRDEHTSHSQIRRPIHHQQNTMSSVLCRKPHTLVNRSPSCQRILQGLKEALNSINNGRQQGKAHGAEAEWSGDSGRGG